MQTNCRRLSASIRRLLDGLVADERRKVALTIDEILDLARQNRDTSALRRSRLNSEIGRIGSGSSPVASSRTFWTPSAEVESGRVSYRRGER